MAEEELNLFEFASRGAAKFCTRPSKVVRRQVRETGRGGMPGHDVPDHFVRKWEQRAVGGRGGRGGTPVIDCGFDRFRNGDRPEATSLPLQVDDDPAAVAVDEVAR